MILKFPIKTKTPPSQQNGSIVLKAHQTVKSLGKSKIHIVRTATAQNGNFCDKETLSGAESIPYSVYQKKFKENAGGRMSVFRLQIAHGQGL
jgi:hypothetical protein